MAEVANTTEGTAKPKTRRAAPRRAAAPKATARKPAGRKPAGRKPAAAKARTGSTVKKAAETMKEAAYVQLGIYGRVYDHLNSRVAKARKDAPKEWNQLVKRGEQVRRDLDKAQKDMSRDLRKRVNDIEIPAQIEDGVEKFRKAVRKLTNRVRKAA